MFKKGEIWAYPTDTSYGLGVRCDDPETLQKLMDLKQRPGGKYFSLMVRDMEMLREYAVVPDFLDKNWFTDQPRTAILQPTDTFPQSQFWPAGAVAFRINTVSQLDKYITVPITATSANLSGEEPIFTVAKLREKLGDGAHIPEWAIDLPEIEPSEIWDFTCDEPKQIR